MTAALLTLTECARMQFRLTRRYPMLIILNVVQPAALLLIVMQRADDDPGRAGELFISVLLTSYWASTIWAAGGVLRRDQLTGTLVGTLINARAGWLVVVGRCLGTTIASQLTLIVTGAVAMTAMGEPLTLPGPGWLVAGFAGVTVSGTALGLLLACLFLQTRHGVEVTSALMYPVFLFGGLLIPQALVPSWLHWVAWLVSLSWARRFMVETSALAGLMFVLVTVAYAVAGRYAFQRALVRARVKGTLELV